LFSFGLNAPRFGGRPAGPGPPFGAADAAGVDVLAAVLAAVPHTVAPTAPPVNSDAAMAPVRAVLLNGFTDFTSIYCGRILGLAERVVSFTRVARRSLSLA
jgi:hypothetical protein